MKKLLKTLFLSFVLFLYPLFAETGLSLYILPFDNIDNSQDYSWLESGFADFLVKHFEYRPDITAVRTSDIGGDLSGLELNHDKTNLLLSGSFSKKPGYFQIALNLTDLNSLQALPQKTIAIHAKDIAEVIRQVNENTEQILKPYLITQPAAVPAPQKAAANTMVSESYQATKNLSDAIDALFDQPEAITAQPVKPEAKPRASALIPSEVESHYQNSRIFEQVLQEILGNPYEIEISDPRFRRNPVNHNEMIVEFSVSYQIRDDLISGLIETLPARKTLADAYTEYFFSLNNFSFKPNTLNNIQQGKYNFYPVLVLTGVNDVPLYHIYDVPATWQSMTRQTEAVFYHEFDPALFLTVTQNGVKFHLKKSGREIKYSIIIPMNRLKAIQSVSVRMSDEDWIMTNQYRYQQ